jgi:hypothetical protein
MPRSPSRLLSLAPLVLLAACQSFTWKGQSAPSADEMARGVKDLPSLTTAYETDKFFSGVRTRMDGRSNAFSRDMDNIIATIDRHFFNYSADDPYVNFPTQYSILDHSLRTGVRLVTPMPLVQEAMRR